jgi:hypothetical protein
MADRYHTPGGWTVEVVQLAEGERLRIRHHGYYIADVRNPANLEHWIPQDQLEYLERDTLILAARPRRPRAGQAVMLRAATTLVGRNRTTSSPGTPFRLPNSSARSGPM